MALVDLISSLANSSSSVFTTAGITTVTEHITTSSPATETYPLYTGYLAVVAAVFLFGSNNLPVKKFETGDGLFFQWILCIGIWMSGLVVNCIQHFPEFHPLAMLGGFLWCTGNIATVPIIKTIGLGQGMLIWALVNMISGWACSRFGWFGLNKDIPLNEGINYAGVALCLVSAVIFMFLKTNTRTRTTSTGILVVSDDDEPLLDGNSSVNESTLDGSEAVFFERLPPRVKRILGISMAIGAGILFGLNFTPVIYIQQHYPGASKFGLSYVFSHFSGILVTSTTYMIIYCIAMRNRPRVYPRIVLPAFVAGVMWAAADCGWFIANDVLSPPISFPIITSLPAIVGALWGLFLFREFKGCRNYVIFCSAMFLALAGSVLTGLSKIDFSNHGDHHNTTTASPVTTTTA